MTTARADQILAGDRIRCKHGTFMEKVTGVYVTPANHAVRIRTVHHDHAYDAGAPVEVERYVGRAR